MYEKVREAGVGRDCAVLIAVGVNDDGYREVIGVSTKISEAELHRREFLESLISRGLHGIELIISDAHSGLAAARRTVLPSVRWQRCQFHLAQNAQNMTSGKKRRQYVGTIVRRILSADTLEEAQEQLTRAVKETASSMPDLSEWMENNIPEGFSHYGYPQKHQVLLRTANPLERINKEVRRRTRSVEVFPNTQSCLRLVSAILMEMSDEWFGRRYMIFEE